MVATLTRRDESFQIDHKLADAKFILKIAAACEMSISERIQ
jgi:hypothetical protein